MKLLNILSKDLILQIDEVPDKTALIQMMVDKILQTPFGSELPQEVKDAFFNEVKKREDIGSTGLGEEVAFPHARINGLERPLIAFASIKKGVEFDSPDELPVHLAFLFLFPARRAELGVKIHAVCGRILIKPEIRKVLMDAESVDEIYSILEKENPEIDSPVIALDVMRPERLRLTPDISINEATQLMHRSRAIAAPVVDEKQHIVGELDCAKLFERELPDYIKLLHSVPHIADFKPFQQYFVQDSRLTVGGAMSECKSMVNEDATLLEIVFLLSVKKYPLLYVCRDGQLLGVIDAITVADKIFNL